jgi:UDP:flavonoid glycosyltransferase YjiC (YdhE family)
LSESLAFLVCAGHSEGHAFPALALARELRERGHRVTVELAERWREVCDGLGLGFVAGGDYVLPGAAPRSSGTPTAVDVARALVPRIEELDLDLVVSDLVAPAPPLAAELAGVPDATLIPTLYPVQAAGMPPWGEGLLPPRTGLGRAAWGAGERALRPLRPSARWLRRVPGLIGDARAELGLPSLPASRAFTTYGTISERLALVATLPQLEYPREWPQGVHVTGPMTFELDHPGVEAPPGEDPLVLVAASTAHDADRELIRLALAALAREPVRVLATINARGETWGDELPPNARVVDWLSYSRVMPRASLVITSGGHGTVARSLTAGKPVLVCPGGADTAENGARVTWAGAGLAVPRMLRRAGAIRDATRRVLEDESFSSRAAELAEWSRRNPGESCAADLAERCARSR